MEPSWTVKSNDGSHLAAYELGGRGEVLLIAHATGLCGAMYQLLADALIDDFRVVALDFRGHGDSNGETAIDLRWDRMAEDAVAVTERIGSAPIHGFGHSMGGAALLLAERNVPGLFSSLFLFEPIIFPDDFSTEGQNVMGDAARRRRVEFESRAEVLYRYASRPPFNQVHAGFLAGYVDNGFADQPDGTVRLKCLPEVEAQVFENGRDVKLSTIEHLTTPVVVAVGHDEPGSNPARMGPPLAEALVGGRLIRYEHIGHFGPLQDPWTVARDIRQHIEAP
ncbi:MAG TPA: alpha/beta hydrolase [Ilumatobacteraceae bacterium]|nr:alpha/beta hydrolase [Ilumatobacteraceae bacterium]